MCLTFRFIFYLHLYRIVGGTSSTVVTTRYEAKKAEDELIPPLPTALERQIRIVKDSDTLGVQVDIEEEGINGLVVRSVTPGGTLARDGRIHPGDYLVAVNGENMRNIRYVWVLFGSLDIIKPRAFSSMCVAVEIINLSMLCAST